MVHQRQRLPLGLKPGDDLFGVHAQLDDLERHPAADRLLLLGHINHAAAAFADLLEQFVAADVVARLFRRARTATVSRWGLTAGRSINVPRRIVGAQQSLDALAQDFVVPAGFVQVGGALLARQLQGRVKDGSGLICGAGS